MSKHRKKKKPKRLILGVNTHMTVEQGSRQVKATPCLCYHCGHTWTLAKHIQPAVILCLNCDQILLVPLAPN